MKHNTYLHRNEILINLCFNFYEYSKFKSQYINICNVNLYYGKSKKKKLIDRLKIV